LAGKIIKNNISSIVEDNINIENKNSFYYYLAGLIEADGSIKVPDIINNIDSPYITNLNEMGKIKITKIKNGMNSKRTIFSWEHLDLIKKL
jgi:hypothetical protein